MLFSDVSFLYEVQLSPDDVCKYQLFKSTCPELL